MGVLTAEFKDVGYVSEDYPTKPVTLETYTEYDPVTMRDIVKIRSTQNYDRQRYYRAPRPGSNPFGSSEPLADWEKELLGMAPDGNDCLCNMCKERRGGSVNECKDCAKWQRNAEEQQQKANEAKAKHDALDTEATNLALELERVMRERDDLLEVLRWYEATE